MNKSAIVKKFKKFSRLHSKGTKIIEINQPIATLAHFPKPPSDDVFVREPFSFSADQSGAAMVVRATAVE